MRQRIITGLLLIIVVAACMFMTQSKWPMLELMTVIAFIGAREWLQFTPTSLSQHQRWAFIVGTTLLCVAIMFAPLVLKIVLWAIAALLWLLALYWVRHYPRLTIWHRTLPLLGIGALLLCATTSALYGLWELNQWWLLYVFILVWTADSGAYFVGRAYGKTKLAVQVSPGKTIEGFAGGLLLCMAVVVVLHFTLHPYNEVSMPKLLLMSLLTVLASVLGDLFESMLKRQAGIKDSGTLLPGHGGVLDRIDSLLAAAPIFALCVFTIGLL